MFARLNNSGAVAPHLSRRCLGVLLGVGDPQHLVDGLADLSHLPDHVLVVDLPPRHQVLGGVGVMGLPGDGRARGLVKGGVPRLGHADEVDDLD